MKNDKKESFIDFARRVGGLPTSILAVGGAYMKDFKSWSARIERIGYWQEILQDGAVDQALHQFASADCDKTPDDIDTYIKETFAEKLKRPEVEARMLGTKNGA